MPRTRMVEVSKTYEPKIGDLWFGREFISGEYRPEDTKDLHYMPLFGSISKWNSLKKFIDPEQWSRFKKQNKYQCPFRKKNSYIGVMPIAIFTKDVSQYEDLINEKDWYQTLMLNRDNFYSWEDSVINLNYRLTTVDTSILGHGYDDGRYPSDGDGKWKEYKINLENGDLLIVVALEWYNK